MSVIEYIFPSDLERLKIDLIEKALCRTLRAIAVEDIERKPRAQPDWASFSVVHSAKSELLSLVVCAPLLAAMRRETAFRYKANRNLDAVMNARKLIWTQYKGSARSDRQFIDDFRAHYLIVATILRLSRGVIDLPENERLYTARGFSRHLREIEHG